MRVIELFSGIGAQMMGIKATGLFNPESVAISEIDRDAVLSYAAIHCGLTPEKVVEYTCPPDEEMARYLTDINLAYNFEENKSYNWGRCCTETLRKYYVACKVTNNLGDICGVKDLPDCDLLTISAPCTDISKAGLCKGMDKGTRSGLVWETLRLLTKLKDEDRLPKYLFMENVKNLIGKTFINDFRALNSAIEELGYNTYWQVLNAEDCGIPQRRERVFVIYIRKDIDRKTFGFPKKIPLETCTVDYLEENIKPRYIMSKDKLRQFIKNNDGVIDLSLNILGTCHYKNDISRCSRELVYNSLTTAPTLLASMYKVAPYVLTLDTEIPYGLYKMTENNIKIHRLTPRECWRLMGFSDRDYEACATFKESDATLRKQAGNSIVQNCVELIFEHLYKAQYDPTYICKDTKLQAQGMNDILDLLSTL